MQKELLKQIKNDKENALRKIELSIKKWENFGEENKIIRKYKNFKNEHWTYSNRFSNLFNIHLLWSNSIIKTIHNVEEFNVKKALCGLQKFYTSISSIKPDLAHPEILKCYNLTAIKNNFTIKRISLKDNLEIEILDPFGNIVGKDKQKIREKLKKFQEIAIDEINSEIETYEESEMLKNQEEFDLKKKSNNLVIKKNEKVDFEFSIDGKKIKLLEDVKFKNLRRDLLFIKKIINSININRPNLKNNLIRKIYFHVLKSDNSKKVISIKELGSNIIIKLINKIKKCSNLICLYV